MLGQALTNFGGDFSVGLLIAAFVFVVCALIVRSNRKLKRREERRASVHMEEIVPAFSQWPPKWRPVQQVHPRAAERIVPGAGFRAGRSK